MRILKCNKLKWDIRWIIAHVIVIIGSIICGIVLFKLNNISNYVYNFADNYVFYVFNFKSGNMFLTHFLSELIYLYVVFFICYCTKLKFLALFVVFLRTLIATIYAIVLCTLFGAEGITVAIFVFIPAFLLSMFFLFFVCEQCREVCSPLCFAFPAILALLNSLILLLLVNVVFRVVIVIV